jgi:putative SOS response-associated peptidase YedK
MGQAAAMCGRYAASRNPAALVEEFGVERAPEQALAADWNIAPTKPVYIVLDRVSPEGEERRRELAIARWGLVPSWAKDPAIGARMNNARLESAAEKPSFRRAFARRRCIVPADGYYEWYTPDVAAAAGAKPVKQPFFIHPADGSVLGMAGLYEWWRDPQLPEDDPLAWRLTMAVLTTAAVGDLARIHDRMPLVIEAADRDRWLDPGHVLATEDLIASAVPASRRLAAYPVATAVNSVRNNGPELVVPLATEAG